MTHPKPDRSNYTPNRAKTGENDQIDIGWNEVINTPGASDVEDVISLYKSGGTSAQPARIHNNFIWGAFPNPIGNGYSGGGIMVGDRVGQCHRCDLPRHAPFVFAPAACAFFAAVIDDGIPVAVGFGLVGRRDLERERFIVCELRSAVQADAGNAPSR